MFLFYFRGKNSEWASIPICCFTPQCSQWLGLGQSMLSLEVAELNYLNHQHYLPRVYGNKKLESRVGDSQ